MAIFVEHILKAFNFDFTKTQLVRHGTAHNPQELIVNNHFDFYQAVQADNIYDQTNYILSFIAAGANSALFQGAYRNDGLLEGEDKLQAPEGYPNPEEAEHPYHYNLNRLEGFEELQNRLVINWNVPIVWHQHFRENHFEVLELRLRPAGNFRAFPGYDNVFLSYQELADIINNPMGRPDWYHTLLHTKGIYLILCQGKQYIGSATGEGGIWGRWQDYVNDPTGGNRGIAQHLDQHPGAERDFKFSIIETFGTQATLEEIIQREHFLMNTHGTNEFGLNHNPGAE